VQPWSRHPFYQDRLKYDTQFYIELSLCNEWGIPHSEFLSWSPDDRSKALSFLMIKSQRCDLCGTAEYEWDENRHAYEPAESFCMGCYMKEVAEEDSTRFPGSSMTLMKTGTVNHAKNIVRQRKNMALGSNDG
jgi:hypothetical protein